MQFVTKHKLCSLLCILLGTAVFGGRVGAQPQTYEFDFEGDLSLWDLSGTYDYSEDTVGLDINLTITQDEQGKLSGSGDASVSSGGMDLDLIYTITGSVTQSNGLVHVKITIKFKGTAFDGEREYRFRATGTVKADVDMTDPENPTMSGTIKVTVSLSGFGSDSQTMPFDQPVDPEMTGSFGLSLNIDQTGKKLTGEGTLTLSNGDTIGFNISGSYNTKANEDRVTITSDNRRHKLKLYINRGTQDIRTLSGKVLGQKLKATNLDM